MWEEILSSTKEYGEFKPFFELYKEHCKGTFNKKERKMDINYNGLAIHTTSKQCSWDLKNWFASEMEKKYCGQ